MSWSASAWAKRLTLMPNGERLTASAKLVVLILAEYFHDERGYAWVSLERLSEEALVTKGGLIKILKRLETTGMLHIERTMTDEHGHIINRYRFPDFTPSQLSAVGVVNSECTRGSQLSALGVVNSVDPILKKKNLKKPNRNVGESPPPPAPSSDLATSDWILSTWNAMPGVKPVLTERLQVGKGLLKQMAVRLREHESRAWWEDLFSEIRQSDWLSGRKPGRDGQPFQCSLSWCLLPENLAKILEGNYRPTPQARAPTLSMVQRPTVMSKLLEEIHDRRAVP